MTDHYSERKRSAQGSRAASGDALATLEEALAAPSPNRVTAWHRQVVEALDVFIAAIDEQAASDQDPDSLLAEIGREEPRFAPRIERLHREQNDLRESAVSLREQITTDATHTDIDVSDIRDRLAALADRYRRHRAREADLVYEAVSVDLGVGD